MAVYYQSPMQLITLRIEQNFVSYFSQSYDLLAGWLYARRLKTMWLGNNWHQLAYIL